MLTPQAPQFWISAPSIMTVPAKKTILCRAHWWCVMQPTAKKKWGWN
jgi:hypothetical protein